MTAAVVHHEGERRVPMTYDEWLAWNDGPSLSEWVDGEAIEFMPASERHQDVVLFLAMLLQLFVDLHRFGKVLIAPFEVRLSSRTSREPDILFVSREHQHRSDGKRLIGAPDLVVEVISDDSVRRDRLVKRDEYAAAGVPEYWIVDCRPGQGREEVLVLDRTGRYKEAERDADGRFRSTVVPGFWLDPAWLRADPLPSVAVCLRAIEPGLFAG